MPLNFCSYLIPSVSSFCLIFFKIYGLRVQITRNRTKFGRETFQKFLGRFRTSISNDDEKFQARIKELINKNLISDKEHKQKFELFKKIYRQVFFSPLNVSFRENLLLDSNFRTSIEKLHPNKVQQNIIYDEIFLGQLNDYNFVPPENITLKPYQERSYRFKIQQNKNDNKNKIVRSRLPNLICIGAKKCGTSAHSGIFWP